MTPPPAVPSAVPDDLAMLAPRERDSSKRDYGRILVVGGSAGMAGAPSLTAMAALRSGAGLVDLAVPAGVVATAASFDPCYMAHGLPDRDEGTFAHDALDAILALAARADSLACGPGLGRSGATGAIVARLWAEFAGPAVFDADSLWWLARLDADALTRHAGPRILTPHAGEMRRFLADGSAAGPVPSRARLEAAALTLAEECGLVILLKGPDTLISDGTRRACNSTGNPGMATGGCGDVLTGVIAALLHQPVCRPEGGGRAPEAYEAARLGAWVHGRAGDLAAADLGELSLTARDLLDHLPRAFRSITGTSAGAPNAAGG